MKRRFWLGAIVTLLWPMIGQPRDLEVPEVGVRFSDIPENATTPSASERPEGYDAWLSLGNALLDIYRADDPVPDGSSVTDSTYRAAVLTRPDTLRKPSSAGTLTVLGSQKAWAYVDTRQLLKGLPLIEHSCIAYVIYDHHLYRLTVLVVGSGSTRQPDYDTLLHALSTLAFEEVSQPPRPVPESAAALNGKMPRFADGGEAAYSAIARHLGEQGAVDVEFSIDGSGHVQNLRQTFGAAPHLGEDIPRVLKAGKFIVPEDWEQSGSQAKTFVMEFQFELTRGGRSCTPQVSPRIPDVTVVKVCAGGR